MKAKYNKYHMNVVEKRQLSFIMTSFVFNSKVDLYMAVSVGLGLEGLQQKEKLLRERNKMICPSRQNNTVKYGLIYTSNAYSIL